MAIGRRAYTQPMAGLAGEARTRKVLGVPSLAITTADNVTGNSIAVFIAPAGFTVTGINATVSDMDSGAGLALSIGDAASLTRFISSSTAGQAGGNITTLTGGSFFTFTADTEVLLTFTVQSAGAVAGTITNFYLEGFIGNP